VHFLRNALAHAGKGQRQVVLAMINTVFAQQTQEAAIAQWRSVADQLRANFPKLAGVMDEAEADVLAFMSFPKSHRAQIHSTIRWRGSMLRSSDGPTSSAFPRTRRPLRVLWAHCCSSRTMNGNYSGAICRLKGCSRSRRIRPLGCRPSSTEHESNRTKTHGSYTTSGDAIGRSGLKRNMANIPYVH
jgi:hypothetical protein